MNKKEKITFRRGDAVTIALVIAFALGMILFLSLHSFSEENLKVQIWQNGEMLQEWPLTSDREFVVEGEYRNTIVTKEGRVAVSESNCPGEDCVHTGWISRSGRSIVCLPNRIEVRIVGGVSGENDVDAVVR